MRLDWRSCSPVRYDQVDPAPQGRIDIMIFGQMIQQPHPKSGQRLMIEIDLMVAFGELKNLFAHARECTGQRQFVQIT